MTESNWPTWLRAAMDAAGIGSGSQLAEKSGIDRSVISNWLNDKAQPTIPNLEKLKRPLGRSLLEMMVAAGLISKEDARLKDTPKPPEPVTVDEVEQEIRNAGYPPAIEKMLLEMRQANRDQIQATVEALRASGALPKKNSRANSK